MGEFGVGQSVPRLEDAALLTGRGLFIDDDEVSGPLRGHVLRDDADTLHSYLLLGGRSVCECQENGLPPSECELCAELVCEVIAYLSPNPIPLHHRESATERGKERASITELSAPTGPSA